MPVSDRKTVRVDELVALRATNDQKQD